ncbi:hypothetical protein BK140_28600 [Paenibacillus macerans]|uniref:DUF6518 family protein n=1 Tax=Paenibacillus sp. FSL R5-0527 TaxID=2975321 RepID=UPI000979DC8F|nr:hypothetical protein BK140_28600 [Paenibacillus macerans]
MGLAAKLVDSPNINPIFDDLGGRLGIWVFVAALLSVFSDSPKLAAVRVFAFFGAMLTVYYVYTTLVLHFFPQKAIVFWGICAVVSPVCAYLMWYARGNGLFANIISALPITILLSEGFELRNAYLPIHQHYYLIPLLMGIYLIMIVVLLFTIPKKKMNILVILPIALILSFIMIYSNVLGRIFGGMNGVL